MCLYSLVFLTWIVQWLRLARSKWPNRVGISPHLRTETDAVSETSCFSYNYLKSGPWTKSEISVILWCSNIWVCGIHIPLIISGKLKNSWCLCGTGWRNYTEKIKLRINRSTTEPSERLRKRQGKKICSRTVSNNICVSVTGRGEYFFS
jgi:hypothetical protein